MQGDKQSREAPESEKNFDNDTTATNSEQSSLPAGLDTARASKEHVEAALQTSTAEIEAEQPVRKIKGIKWIICVLSIFSSVFLYALDNTIVATIQPAIINDLGHLEKLPWVSVAYQVTSVALDLTWYVQTFTKSIVPTLTKLLQSGESSMRNSMARPCSLLPFSSSRLAPRFAVLRLQSTPRLLDGRYAALEESESTWAP